MTRARAAALVMMMLAVLAAPLVNAGAQPAGGEDAVVVFSIDGGASRTEPRLDARMVVRWGPLLVSRDGLAALGTPGADRVVEIVLFDDLTVVASGSPGDFRGEGAFTWSGRTLEGYGEVLLVVTGGRVTGNIVTEAGEFEIRPSGDRGEHVVAQVDRRAFRVGDDSVRVPAALLGPPAATVAIGEDASARAATVIDVMVVYTDASRRRAGGTAAMEDVIRLMVAWTNEAYDNSGIGHDVRLVHMAEVDYDEHPDDSVTDLVNLRCPDGGFGCPADTPLDEVHGWRDTYGADLVVLVADVDDVCGVAYTPDQIHPGYEEWAFGVVNFDCQDNTFAHETGHNQGAMHDRFAGAGAAGPGDYAPYAAGHIEPPYFRTVMAYFAGCPGYQCPPIKHFSNPDVSVTFAGETFPTGVPGTNQATAEDNARVLDEFAAAVSAYRPESVVPPPGDATCMGLPVTLDMKDLPAGAVGVGTRGRDVILGTEGNDRIVARDGDDVICGLGGDDRIQGGRGDDVVDAGGGADVVLGGPGDDVVYGGPGNDANLNGGPGNDEVYGEGGRDQVVGWTGDDVLDGGPGDDGGGGGVILGMSGRDEIFGGGGDDLIRAGVGNDVVAAGDGDDVAYGGAGADLLDGGAGSDELYGGAGDDTCSAGEVLDSC